MRVSIVTPCYNAAHTLPALLESVDAQCGADGVELEHIVMDGGSTDATPEVLRSHEAPWRRVFSEADEGPADAINKGLARTSGEILAWLNADDLYEPGAVARAVEAFRRHPKAAFLFGRCPVVDTWNKEIRRPIRRFKEMCYPFSCRFLLQTLNYVSQPAMFFRRDAWLAAGPLRTDLTAAWDYDFTLRLWRQGGGKVVWGKPLAKFRWTPGSISGSGFERQFDEELAIAKADAGAWSPQAVLHRAVRWGIVTIYRRMTSV